MKTPIEVRSNGSAAGNAFLASFVAICTEFDRKEKEWVEMLESKGFAAAHPDDGWVDRKRHEVHFAYPQFIRPDRLKIGAKVALGTAEKYRIVVIRGQVRSLCLDYWPFKKE